MSRENVELAGQVMDALGRRDLSRLIAFADPEVEWRSFFAELGEGGVYRGHDGTRRYMSDLNEAWPTPSKPWGCGSSHVPEERAGR
jgi:ketosteroid isomerase-like protein